MIGINTLFFLQSTMRSIQYGTTLHFSFYVISYLVLAVIYYTSLGEPRREWDGGRGIKGKW